MKAMVARFLYGVLCARQDGNTVVVCTCAAVSSMGTGVLVGLLALGERMPPTRPARALRLASWLCIAAGVSGLANGSGEHWRYDVRPTFWPLCSFWVLFGDHMLYHILSPAPNNTQ